MATKTWSGGTDNWNDAANWTPAGVPVTGDDVIIDTAGATVTLDDHIGGGQTNTGLASLTINAGTLYTNDGSNRMLTVTGKTLIGAGSGVAGDAVLNCTGSDMFLGSTSTTERGLHVQRGGTFTGGTGTHTIGSIIADNSAELSVTLTSGVTTINGKQYSSSSIFIANGGTFAHGGGTVTLTYAGTTRVYMYNDKALNNFIINNGGNTVEVYQDLTVAGNLTITAGTVNTMSSLNRALTVTGKTKVGDDSSAADTATLTLNGSVCSLGAAYTSGYALDIAVGGTLAAGATGNWTVGSFYMAQSASAKATMTNAECKITSEYTTGNKCWRVEYGGDTFDNNNGTVKFNFNGFDSRMSMRSESHANNAFHNLIIQMNGDSRMLSIDNGTDVKVDNDLTVSRGILNVGSNHNLEVVGHVEVGTDSEVSNLKFSASSTKTATFKSILIGANGTYEATSGTTTLKGEHTNGFAWYNNGTFTDNDGTVTIGDGSSSIGTTHILENRFHHLIINRDASNVNTIWRDASGNTLTIDGNLTITKGFFYRNTVTDTLTVTGDVDIAANGNLGLTADTGANNFGGIKIASGGTYNATSGTTTITNRFTGESHLWKNDGGTFNHNNGTVKFNDNDHSAVKENTFYNVEVASNLGDYAVTFEAQGGGGNAFTILNNLTITRGDFELTNADDTCDIYGQTIINGSSNAGARFNNDKNQTATITHHGLVTIITGTYHVEDGATVNMAGIRNVGGLVD